MDSPIFFDASGKRSLWSKRFVAALLFLVVAAALGFAWTVVSVPADPAIYPIGERIQARPLTEQVAHLRHRVGAWLPPARPGVAKPVSAGFYVPWDPDSRVSLARHIDALDWVIPSVASYTDGGRTRQYAPDTAFHRIIDRTVHKPRVLPMIQNAAGDKWDGAGIEAVMRDPVRRTDRKSVG